MLIALCAIGGAILGAVIAVVVIFALLLRERGAWLRSLHG